MFAAARGNPTVAVSLLIFSAWGLALGGCQPAAPEPNRAAPVEPALSELVAGGQPLLGPGARWRYLDDGSDPGPRWMARTFDDRAWKSGPAPLGFGLGNEATVIGFGPDPANKHATTYFRGEMRLAGVASVAAIERLVVRLQHDDGAAVYLNGVEIYRENLPAGALARTIFSVAPRPPAIVERVLDPAVFRPLLRTGRNVVAAEVHQSDPASPELRFDLAIIANPTVTVTRGPYLQIGAPTEATIRWRTDLPARGRVTYGPMGAGGPMQVAEGAGGLTTEHLVRLTGLSPGTRYDYTVGTPAGLLRGGDGEHFFVTPPPPGAARPTRIWAIGDSGTADANAAAVYQAYREFTGLRHTDVWLMLGDNAYLIGTDEEFQRAVFDFYPEMLRQVFLWPTIGNHETYFGGPVDRYPYLDNFSMPTRGEAGGLASGTKLYYSFDHANIHFVALDSMVSSRAPGAPMWTWLEADLAATDKTWLIAFWHHPPYSKGSHDSDNGDGLDGELVDMREQALPILEAHGVDLVLNGHSHSYERSYFLRGHYGPSTTLEPQMKLDNGDGRTDGTGAYPKAAGGRGANDGAVYVVAGSAGQTTPMRGSHPAMLVSLVELGSLVIDVDGHQLRARFLRDTGEVEDEFAIDKNVPLATVAPRPPTDLRVFAGPQGGAALFWNHEGNDETGFRIERAVRDGPFLTQSELGANATDFADETATRNRFRYRVRATNAAGASEPSNVVMVDLDGRGGSTAGAGEGGSAGRPGRVLRTAGGGGLRCDLGGSGGGGGGWLVVVAVGLVLVVGGRRRLFGGRPSPLPSPRWRGARANNRGAEGVQPAFRHPANNRGAEGVQPAFRHPANNRGAEGVQPAFRHPANNRGAEGVQPAFRHPANNRGAEGILPAFRRPLRREQVGVAVGLVLLLAAPGAWGHGSAGERLAVMDAAIAARPDRAEGYLRRGELLRQLGRRAEALADFSRAAEVQPGIAGVDRQVGRVLMDLGRTDEAIARLDRAIAAAPEDAVAWGMRAEILERAGRVAEAARDLGRMVELRGAQATPDEHLRLVKALRDSKQLARAARALERAIAQLGPVVTLELAAIEVAQQRGRWREAVARVDAFAARVARPEPWLVRKGAILTAAGRRKEARVAYGEALAAIARLPAETQATAAVAQLATHARAGLGRMR